jgi:hypothetical protein
MPWCLYGNLVSQIATSYPSVHQPGSLFTRCLLAVCLPIEAPSCPLFAFERPPLLVVLRRHTCDAHADRAGQTRAGLFGRASITCALRTAGAGENAEAAATRAAATAVRVNIVRVEVG